MEKKFGTDYFLIAHVDLSQVSFVEVKDLYFDYIHQVDDWDTIAIKMRAKKKKPKATSKKRLLRERSPNE